MNHQRAPLSRRLDKLALFLAGEGRDAAAADVDFAAQLVRRLGELENERRAGKAALRILARRRRRKAQLMKSARARKKLNNKTA